MMGGDMDGLVFRHASTTDDPALRALLQAVKLPFEDVASERQDFMVALWQGRVVGCVALERFEGVALLRSLAVAESLRGSGVGRELHDCALARARELGLSRLFLLTTTAAPFFERRGFQHVERSQVPETVWRSPQFANLCPATAACLALSL